MNKECPFKKMLSVETLVVNDNKCAMTQTTFNICTGTNCMAYNDITNTCKLLEKGIYSNECSSSQNI